MKQITGYVRGDGKGYSIQIPKKRLPNVLEKYGKLPGVTLRVPQLRRHLRKPETYNNQAATAARSKGVINVTLNEFSPSVSQAAKQINGTVSAISRILSGDPLRKSHKGCSFRWATEAECIDQKVLHN